MPASTVLSVFLNESVRSSFPVNLENWQRLSARTRKAEAVVAGSNDDFIEKIGSFENY